MAWGDGGDGELGNGTTDISDSPVGVSLPQGTTLAQVAAGYDHDVAVTSVGQVLAWGNGGSGQLGNGTASSSDTPVQVSLPQGTTVTQVAAGDAFSLAVTSTGQIYAWGDNESGELGNASTVQSSDTPVQVSLPQGTTVTQVAAGAEWALALTSSGQVLSWGNDFFGQLGNGTTGQNQSTPVSVSLPQGSFVSEVSAAAGGSFALALTSTGQALTWGYGGGGALGNGSTSSSDIPVSVSLPQVTTLTEVSAGGGFALALTSSGSVLAWGGGSDGQLGNGSTSSSDLPVSVSFPSGTTVSQVSAGGDYGLAVTTTGTALSWGDNAFGELGNGSTSDSDVPGAVSLASGTRLSAVSAGEDHVGAIVFVPATVSAVSPSTGPSYGGTTATITGTGFGGTTAVRFGTRAATSFSVTSSTSITATAPTGSGTVNVTLTGPGGISSTVLADRFTYLTTGSTLAWGSNRNGQLGNGTTTDSDTPVAPSLPAGTKVTATATEYDASLALTSTGQVYAWGDNTYGGLGNGTTTGSDTPARVKLPSGATVTAIAGEGYAGLAVTSSGQVYAWGYNVGGGLGNGTTTDSDTPVQVKLPSGTTVTAVAGESYGGLAVTSTGKVYAWGYNGNGELGDGSTANSDIPVAASLPSGTTVKAVAGQSDSSLALTSTGRVYAWGYNHNGELGNGTTTASDIPVAVPLPPGATATAIAGEADSGVALVSGDKVYAWGYGAFGELGNGTTTESDTPVAVSLPGATTVTAIGSEANDGLALTSTGQVLAWGYNGLGELGNGTTISSDVPVPASLPAGAVATTLSRGLGEGLAVVNAPPLVSAVNPSVGVAAGGTKVTVTGMGFSGVTAVKFGTKAAAGFSVTSPTRLTATSPPGSGSVDVSVTGPNGTSLKVLADRFAYLADGTALDWGNNAYGGLGDGTTTDTDAPVAPFLPAGTTVSAMAGDYDGSLALASTGKVYAWGYGGDGELGNGTLTDSHVPIQVKLPAGTVATAIAAEYYGGLALTSTGKVYAWGYNGYGDLGNGTTTGSDTPVQVKLPSGTTVTAIAGEGYGGLALTSTGTVLAWGYNADGELGNGTTTGSDTPVAVSLPSGTTATAIAGQADAGFAVTTTGKVLAWGYNAEGELGDGSTVGSDTPIAVSLPSATTVTAIAGQAYGGLALTSTGKVLAWGYNADGELGDRALIGSDTPVAVSLPSATTVTAIGSEYETGLALTSSGSVLAWGYGAQGQLGNGATVSSDTPVAVKLPSGVTVSALGQGLGDTGLGIVGSPPSATIPALYVANTTSNTITSYGQSTTGDASPLTKLSGAGTGLSAPKGLLVTSSGQVFVANQGANSVTEYPRDATGDVGPVTKISGSSTGLDGPEGITMDGSGDLFVANATANTITEYAPAASGNAGPLATISGSSTGLDSPQGVTMDASGHLFVANKAANSVTEYAPGATGNATPIAKLVGSSTRLSSPEGVLIDAAGHLRVSNAGSNAVTIYTAGSTGNRAPLTTLSGPSTRLHTPGGMDVDGQGQVAVANAGTNSASVFAPSATGNTLPATTISGAATGLDGPSFVAFTPPPAAKTGRARKVRVHRATLHGVVIPDGSLTRWFFQYRRNSTSSWSNTANAYAGWSETGVRVRIVLTGLRRRTTYFYRLVAVNPGGVATGATRTFSTRR